MNDWKNCVAVIAGILFIVLFVWLNYQIDLEEADSAGDAQRAGSIVVPYIPLPAAKGPNTGIELSAQQNDFQFRCWILPAGTKIIYPDGTEKILFEKGFLTMAKKRGD